MNIEKDYIGQDRDVKRLVDWKNPPTVADLRNDLSEASSSHTSHINKVNSWYETLRGELHIKIADGRSKVQPKLVRKQNEWRYAALEEPFLSTDDMFKVNPVTHLDVAAARQNELILNKQFRVDIPKVKFINKYIRTAVNAGTLIVKLSWESKTDIVNEEQMQPIFAQSPEEFIPFADMLIQQGQLDEQTAMQLLQTGEWQQIPIGEEPITVEVEKEYINRPVLEIKDSRNVIIDPSCEGDINKAQFIVDKFLTDLSTLTEDGRYSNLEKIKEKEYDNRVDSEYDADYRSEQTFRFKDRPRQKLVAFEYWGYWDINNDGIVKPIVATWIGDVMIRLEENPYPDKKLPFVVVQYLPPDTNTVYGDSDASLLKDNQDIIGAVSRGIIDLIGRSANAQTGVRKDVLDALNKERFNKGFDFEFNPVATPDKAFFTTKFPEIPKSALELIQLQNNEAEALTGVKAFSAGISGDALGSQVGAIRSALDATAKRELSILRRLADGLKEIGKKIIAMNSVWLSDEEIIRITDDEFIAIKRDDLAGNFDLVVNVSTAEADNQRANDLTFMMQTMAGNLPFGITKILLAEIAELRKMPHIAQAIKDYEPQPDPLEVAKTEAEIEYLRANTNKDMTAADKNIADAILKEAKAGEAGAKARNINSDADKKDLDYVEQAAGLTQDRELEQIAVKNQAKLTSRQAQVATKAK